MNEFDTAFYRFVGKKLRTLRTARGLTLEYAAKQIGVTAKTVQRYEKGERRIHAAALKALVEALGGEYEEFLRQVQLARLNEHTASLPVKSCPMEPVQGQRIPIVGQISTGASVLTEGNKEEYAVANLDAGTEYFALQACGDSMNALGIHEGCLLIVRRQDSVDDGAVAVVRVDGERVIVRRFYQADTTVTLIPQSTNPAHRPEVYDVRRTHIEVLGRVIKVEFFL